MNDRLADGCQLANDKTTIIYHHNGTWVGVGSVDNFGKPKYTKEFATYYRQLMHQNTPNNNGGYPAIGGVTGMNANNAFGVSTQPTNAFANALVKPVSTGITSTSALLGTGGGIDNSITKEAPVKDYIVAPFSDVEILKRINVDADKMKTIVDESSIDFIAVYTDQIPVTLTTDLTENMINTLSTLDGISLSVCPVLEKAIDELFTLRVTEIKSMSNYNNARVQLKALNKDSFGSSTEAIAKFESFDKHLTDFLDELKSIMKPSTAGDVLMFPNDVQVLCACGKTLKQEIKSLDRIRPINIPEDSYLSAIIVKNEITIDKLMIENLVFSIQDKTIQIKVVM